jgi:transposase
MNKLYAVHLTDDQVHDLQQLLRRGTSAARVQTRARVLLAAHHGEADTAIAETLLINPATVQRIRQRFVQAGYDAALQERPRPGRPPRLTGEGEAHLCMLACSPAPPGRSRWTVQLLADQIVLLELVDDISSEAVRQRLHKNEIKPWLKKQWCIPKPGARFVAKMEDILAVYARPYAPHRPVVCIDEATKLLHADKRPPLPTAPKHPARQDYEYERHGTANLFVWVEPLAGRRGVTVTAQRTHLDFAAWLRELVDVHYSDAERIVLVADNLNTHGPWALYEAFPPAEAGRIAAKLEWHYTPEHGSWLNMAEIEIGCCAGSAWTGASRRASYWPRRWRAGSRNVTRPR